MIGCGGISGSCHGPSYVKYRSGHADFNMAACCDLDAGKAAAYAEKFGFERSYTSFVEMLRREKPDAVCVTVNEEHAAKIGEEVLNMGFPMFIEKPPGKNSGETRTLIEAARKSGVNNQVGYNRRYMPILRRLKAMLQYAADSDGQAAIPGEIQYIKYDICRVGRADVDFSDTAVHGIDAVRYIAGADYKNVYFSYQPLTRYGPGVKNIYMDCVMTNGIHAQLSFCPVAGVVTERAIVHADGDTWTANTPIWAEGYDQPGELTHIHKNKTAVRISGRTLDCFGESVVNSDLLNNDSSNSGGGDNSSDVGYYSSDGDDYNSGDTEREVFITNGFYAENADFFDHIRTGAHCENDLASALNTSLIKDCISRGDAYFNR